MILTTMSEVEVDEIKNNNQNSLLKSKSKESVSDEQGSKSKRVVFQEKPIILNKVSSKGSETIVKTDTTENEKKEKKERNRPPTKVVVRRLPPTMTLETFIDNVSPLPEHDYIYFVRADMSLGPNAFSRAYINFVNMEDLLTFYEQFDNYVFMDTKGNEYPAVVEFAPFQRVPKKRPGRKKDPKVGTLKDDPAFISFVASLKEKKDTSSVKQASAEHLLALTSENSSKKDVSTPLLEFIKQRRAERQRVREEKREERKRKELERKRIKEEERKRRKDGDSVLKVLRNPEHEDKEEPGKNGKERERSQQIMKKREEERRHREKDRKEKRSDIKGRDGPPKNFRDDRQKQVDGRLPRKIVDDPRRKLGGERTHIQNKPDIRGSSEFEKIGVPKEADPRKSPGFSKEQDQKKGTNDKYQNNSKDSERYTKEVEIKKGYKDDFRKTEKSQAFVKENEYKRGNYESKKTVQSFSENDARKKTNDKNNSKSGDSLESKPECSKSQMSDETADKKWELLGAKPKKLISDDEPNTSNECSVKSNDNVSSEVKDKKPDPSLIKLYGIHKPVRIPIEAVKCDSVPGVLLKRRSSLDSDSHHMRSLERMFLKPRRQVSLDSEMFFKNVCMEKSTKSVSVSRSQEFEKRIDPVCMMRRSSLDSGDFKNRSMSREGYGSPCGSTSKLKSDYSVHYSDKKSVLVAKSHGDSKTETTYYTHNNEKTEGGKKSDLNACEDLKSERSKDDMIKIDDGRTSEGSTCEGNKRDPRAERRIRNKDRPSIEIYRPGMGRFSMQRKEREKNAGVGSSTEQESPSNSPSPTPSSRLTNTSKVMKSNQELRSMTFKRSVSREK